MTASTPLHPEAYILVQASDPNDLVSPLEVYLYNPPAMTEGKITVEEAEVDGHILLCYSGTPITEAQEGDTNIEKFCWFVRSAAAFHGLRVFVDDITGLDPELQSALLTNFGREAHHG